MKKCVLTLTLFLSSSAFADGFLCQSSDGLRVKVYGHTNSEFPKLDAAAMIISRPSQKEDKTVAVFTKQATTLKSTYVRLKGYTKANANGYVQRRPGRDVLIVDGKVDLRRKGFRKGEYLIGTRLGYLSSVRFKAQGNFTAGRILRAYLYGYKRGSGEQVITYLKCQAVKS